jgi:hypothetical protein
MEIKKHYASFSEAMREGAKLKPAVRGWTYVNGATCAIGAGLDALGILQTDHAQTDPANESFATLESTYPYLYEGEVSCPGESCHSFRWTRLGGERLYSTIIHLFDEHEWTREAIADWLESEEEKLGYVLLTEEPETCNAKDLVPMPQLLGV